jgi:hypothetical protein
LHHWKYGNGLKEQIYAAAKISPVTGKDDKISYKQKARQLLDEGAYATCDACLNSPAESSSSKRIRTDNKL